MAATFILLAFGFVGLIVFMSLLRGWALTLLWTWFVSPFTGLPQIGIAQAIGFAVVFSLLSAPHQVNEDDKSWKPLLNAILTPVIAVVMGWIVKQWL